MHKIISIQSINDIITNSSSEVFIKTNNKTLKEVLEILDLTEEAIYFNNIEDVKQYILEDYGAYTLEDSDDFIGYNPYCDSYLIESLEKFKSKEEIWDFFKCCYESLIGKAILNIDRDYLYDRERESNFFIDWSKLD